MPVSRQIYLPLALLAAFFGCQDRMAETEPAVGQIHRLGGSRGRQHIASGIARAERDGTRAENRFRLSPKRTSPFKSVGASV